MSRYTELWSLYSGYNLMIYKALLEHKEVMWLQYGGYGSFGLYQEFKQLLLYRPNNVENYETSKLNNILISKISERFQV